MTESKAAPQKQFRLASMTGFGSAVMSNDNVQVEIEVKTVNHRFLDCVIKAPRLYATFEHELQKEVRARLERGRVEVYVCRTPVSADACQVVLHRALFDAYYAHYEALLAERKLATQETHARAVFSSLAARDVLERTETGGDVTKERSLVKEALRTALDKVAAMRFDEGNALYADIASRVARFDEIVSSISSAVVGGPERIRERIESRLAQAAPDIAVDESRLVTEIVMYSERADVSEEITRLASHVSQFYEIISKPPCGRKLDFIIQEMGREINTIASKAQEASVHALVVDGKAELEKIREQVQNVE